MPSQVIEAFRKRCASCVVDLATASRSRIRWKASWVRADYRNPGIVLRPLQLWRPPRVGRIDDADSLAQGRQCSTDELRLADKVCRRNRLSCSDDDG